MTSNIYQRRKPGAQLGIITEWLKRGLAETMGQPIPETAYFYCRLNESHPDFRYSHIILMDQRCAVHPEEARKVGWMIVGPANSTSPNQINAFASLFPEHFSDARFAFGNRDVVPDNRVAFELSAPIELVETADLCIEDIASTVTQEWSMLFKEGAQIKPHIPMWDIIEHRNGPIFPHLTEKFAALSRAGLLFFPHVQILPHTNERLLAA